MLLGPDKLDADQDQRRDKPHDEEADGVRQPDDDMVEPAEGSGQHE
jgi:hypothetical protein